MGNNIYKNQKIAAIDYGRRRIGLASCDFMHVTITPRFTIDTSIQDKYSDIVSFLEKEEITFVVIGIPERDDNKNDNFIAEIRNFSLRLKEITGVEVIEYDESFSTRDAASAMLGIGLRRKKRSDKSRKDMVAAAVILRNFLTNVVEPE